MSRTMVKGHKRKIAIGSNTPSDLVDLRAKQGEIDLSLNIKFAHNTL